jgi:membrane-associated phospholipid phosphatase
MNLPLLIYDRRTRALFFFISIALTNILYQLTNRFQILTPQILPMSGVDQMIPLQPWTVWLYFLEYPIFLAYFWIKDDRLKNQYLYAYLAILVISCCIFMVYPVAFPRQDFGLEGYPSDVSVWLLSFLRTYMDAPTNCLPSLHVSSCFITAAPFWREHKGKFWFLFLISIAVSYSTMSTKQHYFIDVWTGLILTVICYWLFFHKAKYYSVNQE